jgi:acetylornithine deacetylase/succinyl-diaminopimelate desuccinylase-like protein
MDSTALQLAIRYATKSGKITLAQKITDELVEQRKDQEQKEIEIQRSSSPPPPLPAYSSSTISISSSFEEVKQTRPKATTSNGPFSNPFRKKLATNSSNESSATDELSKWKPSVNKSRLPSSNKTTIQV